MTLHSPNLLQKITNLKLDIIDQTNKKLHIFELTLATNMEQMGIEKHKNTYNSSQTSQDTTAQ